ncbi:MAG TPA: FAD-dependent oxidoreductase [Gemmatimonadales bacterium]|nr:FAD-dependent oxidoreductase [Gemmatimonadales bacterium]
MDLRSGCPFWMLEAGERADWPDLDADVETDVLVVGAGITGGLAAWRLAEAGFDVVLLDRREVGQGSTAASTALLQYELDTPLRELRTVVGTDRADRAYLRCIAAFDALDAVLERLGERAGFARRPSLYLAQSRNELSELRRECADRSALGIAVEFLDRGELGRRFGIDRPGALLSAVGGEIDAYRLTLRLVEAAARIGTRVRTGPASQVTAIEAGTSVVATTAGGHRVRARSAVVATGYEFAPCLPERAVTLHSTYAVATPPLATSEPWPDHAIVWETARPYLYLRSLPDGRVIVGGADEPFADAARRDALIDAKATELIASARALFPALELEADCAWAGVFAETPDGLPYIGRVPEMANVYGSLAYGGNGITFGIVAAEILVALCRGSDHPDAALFGFER